MLHEAQVGFVPARDTPSLPGCGGGALVAGVWRVSSASLCSTVTTEVVLAVLHPEPPKWFRIAAWPLVLSAPFCAWLPKKPSRLGCWSHATSGLRACEPSFRKSDALPDFAVLDFGCPEGLPQLIELHPAWFARSLPLRVVFVLASFREGCSVGVPGSEDQRPRRGSSLSTFSGRLDLRASWLAEGPASRARPSKPLPLAEAAGVPFSLNFLRCSASVGRRNLFAVAWEAVGCSTDVESVGA
jgi:hypothetical protein